MINGLSGRPGAGKSYECVVNHIIPALEQKRKIITNIPLNIEWFVSVLGAHVRHLIVIVDGGYHEYGKTRMFSKAADFLQYDTWRNDDGQGVYFFIDECHLAMPVGSTDKSLKEYLSMHRHYGHDLMLLTQNFRKVDRDVKDMIQTCYFCTKLSMLGKDDQYVCKVADGVTRNIVHTHHRAYEPKYFAAYQSHTKVQGSVKESETTGVKKWYQRGTTLGAIACFFAFLFIIVPTLTRDKPDSSAKAQQHLESLRDPSPVQPSAGVVTSQHQQSQQQQQQQTGSRQPQQASEPQKSNKGNNHPFEGLQIHLSGWYADFDHRGRYSKRYYFALSRNGSLLTEITNADLVLAGYTVKVYNACAAELTYGSFSTFALCDAPTVGIALAGEQLASNN